MKTLNTVMQTSHLTRQLFSGLYLVYLSTQPRRLDINTIFHVKYFPLRCIFQLILVTLACIQDMHDLAKACPRAGMDYCYFVLIFSGRLLILCIGI